MKHSLSVLCIILESIILLLAPAFGQCPPGSTPNPSISSSFTPDSSCIDTSKNHNGSIPDREPCLVSCENQYATYCSPLHPLNTYTWAVTGGTITAGQGSNCVTVLWGPAGPGTISVTETTPDTCSGMADRCVKIINSPIASFTANTTVCLNTPVAFINTSVGATHYFWNFGDGNTSTQTNPSHGFATPGT